MALDSMFHLNGHLLCAVDTESTGLVPGHHDIIQFAAVPLDDFLRPSKRWRHFEILLRPRRPDNIDDLADRANKGLIAKAMVEGHDPDVGADLFDDWFNKLQLAEGKKITILGMNWIHDKGFVQDWMGVRNYELRIHHHYRDLMSTSLFINDVMNQNAEKVPFGRNRLSNLCHYLKVEYDKDLAHEAVYDCIKTAECYKVLCDNTRFMFYSH